MMPQQPTLEAAYGPPPGGGPPGGYGGPPPGGFGPPGGAPPGGGYGGPPPGGFGGPPGYGPQGFGPPGGFPPPGGPMMPGMGPGGDVNTTLPLILNIVAALFCWQGCISFVLAIVGIVFAVQAGSAKTAGDVMTAQSKARTSMMMAIIAAVIGFLSALGWSILRAVGN